jgi:hypothetical protein
VTFFSVLSLLINKTLIHIHLPISLSIDLYSINMAPATTASKPSLTTTAFAAPVCAAEDEDATLEDPVCVPLLDFAELLDCLAELLNPVEETLLLVAALAAKEPLLEALPLDEAAAVA